MLPPIQVEYRRSAGAEIWKKGIIWIEIYSYGIICKDLLEDKKKIFLKDCLNYLLKKMSLIISLVDYENPLLSGKVNRQHKGRRVSCKRKSFGHHLLLGLRQKHIFLPESVNFFKIWIRFDTLYVASYLDYPNFSTINKYKSKKSKGLYRFHIFLTCHVIFPLPSRMNKNNGWTFHLS